MNWFEGTPTTNRAGEQHQTTKVRTTSGFSGAPLDAVKVASACLMLADHVNYAFFGHVANFMWYLGRPVFPLFVFAMVCNLIRGTDALEYVGKLILLGVVSQPFYATLMATDQGNTLFTLAVLVMAASSSSLSYVVVAAENDRRVRRVERQQSRVGRPLRLPFEASLGVERDAG